MAYDIIHKNSTVSGTPPAGGEIEVGEIAINAADAELYVKDTAGNVKKFANTDTTGTAAGMQFTQAGSGAVQRTVESKLQDVVSVKDFGAVGDGVTDDTAAIRAAVATQKPVIVPTGAYLVKDMITLNNGQIMQGDGETKSRLIIPSDFNLSALGVVRLGTAEPGAILRDIGFEFEQPTTAGTTRANLIQYPPAVYAVGVPRFLIDNVRWSRAWIGLNMTGNSGGAYIGRVDSCAFNYGLAIDGSLDFVHIESWHNWPFGASTEPLVSVFGDGSTIAAQIGHCDGLAIDKLASFTGKVVITDPGPTIIPNEIGVLQLDGNGSRLVVSGGLTNIGQLYTTKGFPLDPTIHITGGSTTISLANIAGGEANNQVLVEDGVLRLNGGEQFQNRTDTVAGKVSGGLLEIRDMSLRWPNVGRSSPFYEQTGTGSLRLINTIPSESQTAASNLVTISSDNLINRIEAIQLKPSTVTLPATLALGHYETGRILFTPSLEPTTLGDWSVGSYAARVGSYQLDGDWVDIQVRFVGTPTFTTASGSLAITGLPFNFSADSEFTIGWSQGFNLGSGFTTILGRSAVGTSKVEIFQAGASVAIGPASTAEITTGTPVHLLFAARVRLR